MQSTRIFQSVLALVLSAVCASAIGQQAPPAEFTLGYWMAELGVSQDNLRVIPLPRRFTADGEVAIPDTASVPVGGFAVSGMLRLKNDHRSLVRIILVARDGAEYLVYEATPLTLGKGRIHVEQICDETCVVDGIVPERLKVEVVDAVMRLSSLATVMPPARVRSRALPETAPQAEASGRAVHDQVREQQLPVLIERLNNSIRMQGLRWVAGDTPIARMTYAERKARLGKGRDEIPNFQGFEYYVGGIFEVRATTGDVGSSEPQSRMIDVFDWRSRHGANTPDSPYFDGDSWGTGWLTRVKWQECANCWAHAANGAVEAQANLFFNDHIDLDLSEQDLISCARVGSCVSGGSPLRSLEYIRDVGVVDQACFPNTGTDGPCSDRCASPDEIVRIADVLVLTGGTDDQLKAAIVRQGPIVFNIPSWWHSMVAVGFQRDPIDGRTIWILKNSWGFLWGEKGFGYVKVADNDRGHREAVVSPVQTLLTGRDIACRDEDGDGYFNWGISALPPATCPPQVYLDKDCNDWDATVGPYAEDGGCIPIETDVNAYVSFEPDPESYMSSADTSGCPGDCTGTFRFDARLTNESRYALTNLQLDIERLTGGNVLLTDAGHLVAGDRMPVPHHDGYADGELAADEWMDMTFTVCLKRRRRFSFFVNVIGLASEVIDTDAGLVGFYPFDGNTKDASGNGNHAVPHGVEPVAGVIGQAYQFDGKSSYIDTPININPDVAPELTMMAWVYPHRTGGSDVYRGGRQIFSCDDLQSPGYDRSLLMENEHWTVFYGGGYWVTRVPVDVRAWQHVAVVIEPEEVRFYKNGIENRRFVRTGSYLSTNTARIGTNPAGYVQFFDGVIDEVRIYHRGLSTSEIMDRYLEEQP